MTCRSAFDSFVVLEFTLYNPTINVFVPIRAFVRRTLAGAVKPDVDLLTALLLHGRFQPSIIFEVILLAVAVVQVRCQGSTAASRVWLH